MYFFDVFFYFDEKKSVNALLYKYLKKRFGSKFKFHHILKIKKLVGDVNARGFDDGIPKRKRIFGIFKNTVTPTVKFNCPTSMAYRLDQNKLYICDSYNHVIRCFDNQLKSMTEKRIGNITPQNADKSTTRNRLSSLSTKGSSHAIVMLCKLKRPQNFVWDKEENMYITDWNGVCKFDVNSNTLLRIAGRDDSQGFRDGKKNQSLCNVLTGIACFYKGPIQHPFLLVCDFWNHCIREINLQNMVTRTITGSRCGEKERDRDIPLSCIVGSSYNPLEGDVDGILDNAMFRFPWCILKDEEDEMLFYISDSANHKVRILDMNKGIVETLVKHEELLCEPRQMCILGSNIYIACKGHRDGIISVDKTTKQIFKIHLDQQMNTFIGLAYNPSEKCFYMSDMFAIYRLY